MAMQAKTEERAAAGMPQMNGQQVGALMQQQSRMMQESVVHEVAMVLGVAQQYMTPVADALQFVHKNMQPNDSEFHFTETLIIEIEMED